MHVSLPPAFFIYRNTYIRALCFGQDVIEYIVSQDPIRPWLTSVYIGLVGPAKMTNWLGRMLLYCCIVVCGALLLLHISAYYYGTYSASGSMLGSSTAVPLIDSQHDEQLSKTPNYTPIYNGGTTTDDEVRKFKGYLLVVDYTSQMMSGFCQFYHLASISALLKLYMVEPYVQGFGLHGAPYVKNPKSDPQVVKITSFYDLKSLKPALKTCANSSLVSFEEFAINSSRNIVIVTFLTSLEHFGHYFSAGNHNRKIVEIATMTSNQKKGLRKLNSWLSYVRDKEGLHLSASLFTVSRVILVDARPLHPLPMSDLMKELGSVIQQEVAKFGLTTVVVNEWRGIQTDFLSGFYYFFKGFSYKECDSIEIVKHSKAVISATEKFKLSLNDSDPVVGVHIRAERLLLDFDGSKEHFTGCLTELNQVLKNGTIANVRNGSVRLFHDMGKYGSSSCNLKKWQECDEHGREFLNKMTKEFKNLTVSFNPSSFHPTSLQATFASFVENEYMSGVDVLVTVGRGNYQDNIVKRFLKKSGRKNLHRICNNPQPTPKCYPNC